MNGTVDINEITEKITKEVIKDEVYDDGEINDYILDEIMPIHDRITKQVRAKLRGKRQYRFVLLVKDVLKDYKKVMDLKYTVKYWYADQDPSVDDNRNHIPHNNDIWLQDLIKLYAKYGLTYEYDYDNKKNRCGNYEKMINKLIMVLEGLLINRENYMIGLGLDEKCISLERLHSLPTVPKP